MENTEKRASQDTPGQEVLQVLTGPLVRQDNRDTEVTQVTPGNQDTQDPRETRENPGHQDLLLSSVGRPVLLQESQVIQDSVACPVPQVTRDIQGCQDHQAHQDN